MLPAFKTKSMRLDAASAIPQTSMSGTNPQMANQVKIHLLAHVPPENSNMRSPWSKTTLGAMRMHG